MPPLILITFILLQLANYGNKSCCGFSEPLDVRHLSKQPMEASHLLAEPRPMCTVRTPGTSSSDKGNYPPSAPP